MWDSATLNEINNLNYFSGEWKENSEESAQEFSAIAYHFGKSIQTEENIPIGLIDIAVGGSPLISWIDRLSIECDPLLVNTFRDWQNTDYMQAWCRGRAKKNLELASDKNQRHPYEPAYNYESGISKLTNFPIKGVLWYQGESDANNLELHEKEFTLFVKSWREKWGINFPFYYVQLSSLNRPTWPDFRDAQNRMQKIIPNSGMAVSMDYGDSTDVHPIRKKEIGNRLALLALKNTYGKPVVANGPAPLNAVKSNDHIVISFTFAKKFFCFLYSFLPIL